MFAVKGGLTWLISIHFVLGGRRGSSASCGSLWRFFSCSTAPKNLFGFLAPPEAVTPPLLSLMGLAGVLEFFGGLLVVLGLFTRPAAFILSGQMAVAYFMVHAPNGFWPLQNKGDLAMLWSFVFLYLAVAGGGEWSLDRAWRRDGSSSGSDTAP